MNLLEQLVGRKALLQENKRLTEKALQLYQRVHALQAENERLAQEVEQKDTACNNLESELLYARELTVMKEAEAAELQRQVFTLVEQISTPVAPVVKKPSRRKKVEATN